MKRLALVLSLFALPATADEPAAEAGSSLMEQGAKLFLRGLMSEMEPTLNDMQTALDQIGPQLESLRPQITELIGMIGDFQNYHPPVKLPNGDVLIRRKTPAEIERQKTAPAGPPEIEL